MVRRSFIAASVDFSVDCWYCFQNRSARVINVGVGTGAGVGVGALLHSLDPQLANGAQGGSLANQASSWCLYLEAQLHE